MTPPTTYLRPDVAAYVAAVRGHLDDLSGEEVEELAGGLAADLSDLAAESTDPLVARVGSPQAYADELRAAAGLPARGARGRRTVLARARRDWARDLGVLREQSWWPAVSSFFVTLRPAWWVARAVVAFGLLLAILGGGPGSLGLVLLAGMVVVSVELGRGRWDRWPALTPLVLIGNVVAVLLLPWILLGGLTSFTRDTAPVDYGVETPTPGLAQNGEPLGNVFAYDSDGKPLTGVQLFDEQGHPLSIDVSAQEGAGDDGSGHFTELVPRVDSYGRQVPNAYPILRQEKAYDDQGASTPVSTPTLPVPPLAAVPPLAPAPTSTPSEQPTTTPSEQPTTTPSDASTTTPPSTTTLPPSTR